MNYDELYLCSPTEPTSMAESHRRADKINSSRLRELFGKNPIIHNCLYRYIREKNVTYEESLEITIQEMGKIQEHMQKELLTAHEVRPVEILVKPEEYYTLTWRARFNAFWKAVTWDRKTKKKK